jgi:osmotically-inducible protein OsmY
VTREGEIQLSGFFDTQSQSDRAVKVDSTVEIFRIVGNGMSINK